MRNVDHGAAHAMIAALSITPEGRALVKDLEEVRYYHRAGKIADLGHGAVLVTAVDENALDYDRGIVLLPGRRDRLWYEAADWLGSAIPAALYWKYGSAEPVVIPRVLGEWAAECIVSRSECAPLTPAERHPAAYSVDGLAGMVVTMPYDLQMPGLTRDKWARRRVFQDHYVDDGSWCTPQPSGYSAICTVLYGVRAYDIHHAIRLSRSGYDLEEFLALFTTNVLRAACQVASGYLSWQYFDNATALQCARHLYVGDYAPRDLTEFDLLADWERELLDGEAPAGVA